MLSQEIRKNIIRPVLQVTDLWSENAEMLVYGTGMIESNYDSLIQIGNPKNGGLGFWQCEPSDYKDICKWLNNGAKVNSEFNKNLADRVLAACYFAVLPSDPLTLISNIKFACLICRLHYYRISDPIPSAKDAAALAHYHYKYYNGDGLGKTNIANNTILFQKLVDEGNGL